MRFRATSDNHPRNFHGACDQMGPTLVIAKSWDGDVGGYMADPSETCFLFSWKRPGTGFEEGLVKFPLLSCDKGRAIVSQYNYGPCFGNGHDLYLGHDCFSQPAVHSTLLTTYGLPHPIPEAFDSIRTTMEVSTWLGGALHFSLTEYEVYLVTIMESKNL
ncbi:hypothetical protein Pelo_17918 [Pelomyxa schiedti]|nr:hypothetical protein Pelo_17918 [Pelomyxa schiedti]